MSTILVNQHQVPVKNLDKIFWPKEGYTKSDIIQYYTLVWPYLAPHLKGRPVSLVRYPEGINGDYFYQKNVPNPPPWVTTIPIQSEDRTINYAIVNNLETLIWCVNLGCIELHPWLSTVADLNLPTYLIFDLDPMEPAEFSDAVKIAQFIKVLLTELNLKSFPKISGATGIHIYLPLVHKYSYQQTGTFVKKIGAIIIEAFPDLATNERKIANRRGKVYIDHLQNSKGKTIASVYSLRPLPGAPVSTPVAWDELSQVRPAMFNIQTVPERIKRNGDYFNPLLFLKQELPEFLLRA
jgi:bifunctional non-homologous end joining protein LigD